MNARKAITRADTLRPNAVGDELKFSWLFELDGRVAEMMGAETPENTFPEDAEMLMGPPHENIYELYLCAMIDFAQQDTALYANDSEIFNAAFDEARAYYRRHNKPDGGKYWRVW